jgi:hypothetical protein
MDHRSEQELPFNFSKFVAKFQVEIQVKLDSVRAEESAQFPCEEVCIEGRQEAPGHFMLIPDGPFGFSGMIARHSTSVTVIRFVTRVRQRHRKGPEDVSK